MPLGVPPTPIGGGDLPPAFAPAEPLRKRKRPVGQLPSLGDYEMPAMSPEARIKVRRRAQDVGVVPTILSY